MSDPDFLKFNCNREYNGEVTYDNPKREPWAHPKIKAYPIRYKTDSKGNRKIEVFDFDERRYRNPYSYSKKQKRLFHRTYSGLQVGYHQKQMLIFLTLTTAYKKKENDPAFNAKSKRNSQLQAERTLNIHWQKFKQNLEYEIQKIRFKNWLLKTHGLDLDNPNNSVETRREIRRLKRYNYSRFKFKLNYLKVRTTEGGGVLHVLIRKNANIPKFPIDLMKEEWERIHGAHQVFIEKIEVDPEKPLKDALNASFYFCGNYFNQQPVVRQSSSYNWIFKGAAAVWLRGKTIYSIKKYITERQYGEYCDKYNNLHTYTTTKKIPNVLYTLPSILQRYAFKPPPNRSADSKQKKIINADFLEGKKISGFDQAMIFWRQVLKDPPKSNSQTRLASKISRQNKKSLTKPIFRFNCFGGSIIWAKID